MIRNFYGKAKSAEEIGRLLHSSAIVYSKVCNKMVLFISRSNAAGASYHYYETYYGKENFIHLVGCTANKLVSAEKFYEECFLTEKIPKDYITFKESRRVTSNKLDIFESLFDFQHIKLYKLGKHDKINEKNSFQIGLGNSFSNGVLGYIR